MRRYVAALWVVACGCGSGGEKGGTTPTAFDFTPSNFGTANFSTGGPDVVVDSGCSPLQIDTTSQQFACGLSVPSIVVAQGGGPSTTVFLMNSLRIEPGVTLTAVGSNALGFAVKGSVTISGTIDMRPTTACSVAPGGSAGGVTSDPGTAGQGTGGGAPPAAAGGGSAGGSYGGTGGAGGSDTVTPISGGAAAAAFGTDTLIPLRGGSGGASVFYSCGGSGGGAVQISAAASISLPAGGGINAGGAGGGLCGSGGGSGGGILLEAPTVTIASTLAANGGGGGGGGLTPDGEGQFGQLSVSPANGGLGGTNCSGGGAGSSGVNANGAPGANTDLTVYNTAGGGAGASGRIRINSRTPPSISGALSPGTGTGMATTGSLAP